MTKKMTQQRNDKTKISNITPSITTFKEPKIGNSPKPPNSKSETRLYQKSTKKSM